MREALARVGAFLRELRRRHVYKVAVVYVVLPVAGLELVDVVVPASRLPGWSDAPFLALAVMGFPVAMALAGRRSGGTGART